MLYFLAAILAAMARLNKQRCPYNVHLRERVVFMRVIGKETDEEIAATFGGFPCTRTVKGICEDFFARGRIVSN